MFQHDIHIRTRSFDGPLGLLLLLVQKEEMDIKNLDVAMITSQYLEYLNRLRELNFNVAGDYLFLASTLIYLKSVSAIGVEKEQAAQGPEDELQIQSKEDLISRLEELQHFQEVAGRLWKLPRRDEDCFTRPKGDKKSLLNSLTQPTDLNELVKAMLDVMRREKRKISIMEGDKFSIADCIKHYTPMLKPQLTLTLEDLFQSHPQKEHASRQVLIITFISLLELARLKKVQIYQLEGSPQIYVEVLESLEELDMGLATGFDAVTLQ